MTDNQLAMLLTAMSDQTAAMNRMADAMVGILLHLDPKQAAKFAAPGYQRPLAAYATFDWNSIDATVIGFDRHGATEVEHNGVAYRRYRSNDDDPKGVDIRFRRVVAGTPEGKDMVWATLIKFADKKAKEAPRPLRGELAEKIEQAAAEQAKSANAPTSRADMLVALNAGQKPPEPLPPPVAPPAQPPSEPEPPVVPVVSVVNRAAVSSLQGRIDEGYFNGTVGNERLVHAMKAAKEQLALRGMDEAAIKASLAKATPWLFFKAAVAAMVQHDLAAPHEEPPF